MNVSFLCILFLSNWVFLSATYFASPIFSLFIFTLQVPLGVLLKNENVREEMLEILQTLAA